MEQACRSISLYKGENFPLTPEKAAEEKVLIAGPFSVYQSELKKRYKNADIFYYRYTMDSDQLESYSEDIKRRASRYDTIIVLVANEETASLANSLKNSGKKVMIISILSPNFVISMDWADTILFAYSYSDYSFKAVAAVLAGEIPAIKLRYGTRPEFSVTAPTKLGIIRLFLKASLRPVEISSRRSQSWRNCLDSPFRRRSSAKKRRRMCYTTY